MHRGGARSGMGRRQTIVFGKCAEPVNQGEHGVLEPVRGERAGGLVAAAGCVGRLLNA